MNKKGVTEAQLAERLGVSKKTVHRYLKSGWNPRIRKVVRIFMALDDTQLDIKGINHGNHKEEDY
jgi:transcriptional regulator with XRE-family HTH domain